MGKKKAIEKVKRVGGEANVTNAELITALEASGYSWDGGKGSHRAFRHADGRTLSIPIRGSKPKRYIVQQVREAIS